MLWAFSLEAVGAGHKFDYSLPSSAKVKNVWNYIVASSPCPHGVLLNKCRYKCDPSQFKVGTVPCEVAGYIKQSSTLVFYWIVLSISWNIQ
jgi:hypothetical protein